MLLLYWFYTGERVTRLNVCVCESSFFLVSLSIFVLKLEIRF